MMTLVASSSRKIFFSPNVIFQKNFLDDRLVFVMNAGVEWAWGKKPAEEYAKEFSIQGGAGVAYRFAPNWFIGVDSRVRSEFPDFDLGNHEHTVVFAGPALHYAAEKWWATFTWGNQIWGRGVDETGHRTFAEESRNEFILKVGLNFLATMLPLGMSMKTAGSMGRDHFLRSHEP